MKPIIVIDDKLNQSTGNKILHDIKNQLLRKFPNIDEHFLFAYSVNEIFKVDKKTNTIFPLFKNIPQIKYIFIHASLNEPKLGDVLIEIEKWAANNNICVYRFSGGSRIDKKGNILSRERFYNRLESFIEFFKRTGEWYLQIFYEEEKNAWEKKYLKTKLSELYNYAFNDINDLTENIIFKKIISLMNIEIHEETIEKYKSEPYSFLDLFENKIKNM